MKGIRTDLVIVSILLSLAAHFGVMYYAEPKVMTRVASGIQKVVRRGPMKVSEAPDIPPPVEIDTVKDVEADKQAPMADETIAVKPKLEADLPVSEGDLAVPEVAMPEISTAEIPVDRLPEVMTAALSPVAAPEMKMVSDATSAPVESDKLIHVPSATPGDMPIAPTLALPELAIEQVPTTQAEEEVVADLAKEEQEGQKTEVVPDFVPPPQVMDKVDEKIVEAEKDAVRSLVDTVTAADLAKVVNVSLTRTQALDGQYFRVTITPKGSELATVSKDVVVLIDASGSIGRDRMISIRAAAKRILRSAANTGDRFNLVAFRDRFTYAFKTWQDCTVQSFAAADKWLGTVAPFGRTDVFATIRSVLTLPRDPTRPLIALVVTDGDANAGVSSTAEILSKFSKLNDGLVSVYMYGVKSSANRELIEVLTQGNRGESFIFEETGWGSSSRAGTGIEPLSRRFRDPVLTDLRLVFASDCTATTYPRLLKNLYAGESVTFVGRVPDNVTELKFSLKGLNGKDAYEAFFRLPLAEGLLVTNLDRVWTAAHNVDLKLR